MLIEHAPVVLLVLVVAGVALTALGVRGRRLNDHPACRGCGFDLMGVYPGRETCPECGRGLAGRRAVRRGVRERRRGVMYAGIACSLLVALAGLGIVWLALAGPTMNAHKPVFVLALEGRHGGVERSKAAADELLSRLNAGGLSDGQLALCVSTALAVQQDESHTWHAEWGDIVEGARLLGKLEDTAYDRFLRQSVLLMAWSRPEVGPGSPVPVAVGVTEWRRGKSSSSHVALWVEQVRVNGVVQEHVQHGERRVVLGNSDRGVQITTSQQAWSGRPLAGDTLGMELEAPPGAGTQEIEFEVRMRAASTAAPGRMGTMSSDWRSLEPTVMLRARTAVRESGGLVPLEPAPENLAQVIRRMLSHSVLEVVMPGAWQEEEDATAMVHLAMTRPRLSPGLAYRVTLEVEGRRYPLGTYVTGPAPRDANLRLTSRGPEDSRQEETLSVAIPAGDVPAEGAVWRVELTPEPSLAERTLDSTGVLDLPLVLELTPAIRR